MENEAGSGCWEPSVVWSGLLSEALLCLGLRLFQQQTCFGLSAKTSFLLSEVMLVSPLGP